MNLNHHSVKAPVYLWFILSIVKAMYMGYIHIPCLLANRTSFVLDMQSAKNSKVINQIMNQCSGWKCLNVSGHSCYILFVPLKLCFVFAPFMKNVLSAFSMIFFCMRWHTSLFGKTIVPQKTIFHFLNAYLQIWKWEHHWHVGHIYI